MKDNVVQVNLCLTIGEMWSSRNGWKPIIYFKEKKGKEYEKIIRNRSIDSYLFRIFFAMINFQRSSSSTTSRRSGRR